MRRLAFLTVLVLILPLGSLRAQDSADEAVATVQALFDAMRAADTTSMRGLFDDGARLVMTYTNQEGEPGTRVASLDQFIQNVGAADGVIDEQIWDVEVRIEDNLATVWDLTEPDRPAIRLVEPGDDIYPEISPDGRWIATRSDGQIVRLWDLNLNDPSAEPIELGGHSKRPRSGPKPHSEASRRDPRETRGPSGAGRRLLSSAL